VVLNRRDDHAIRTRDAVDDATLSFEAGWNADGAVCVAHSRIPENITLAKLKTYCPQLAAISTCDEGAARAGPCCSTDRDERAARNPRM